MSPACGTSIHHAASLCPTRPVVLNQGGTLTPGDIRQHSETLLVVTSGGVVNYYWHLVRYCYILQGTGGSHNAELPAQDVNSADTETPGSGEARERKQSTRQGGCSPS